MCVCGISIRFECIEMVKRKFNTLEKKKKKIFFSYNKMIRRIDYVVVYRAASHVFHFKK